VVIFIGVVSFLIVQIKVSPFQIFQATKIVSQRQLIRSKRINHGYTLSQRFQLQENLRMIIILKRIMYSFIICVSLMIGCFLFGVFMLGDPFGVIFRS
jgi:hypothetical protein